MADNILSKSTHKLTSSPAEHNANATTNSYPGQMPTRKISAPVHRTTTETIRLGEPIDNNFGKSQHHHHHHAQSMGSIPVSSSSSMPNSGTANAQNRTKKTSSFQITSVTVGCRMSNDAGEDSNDDLDESHTEDNSVEHSRLTDIETPSYSEDTFSKDDVFFNASNAALSTAPVIPTSSQYGLAIVPSSETNITNNSTNDSNINTLDITSVTDNNIINLLSSTAKQDADLRDVHSHGRNERFKVVKIESTEPFKRGRWTCMDYLDHTSVNQSTAAKVPDPNEVCISYGVTDAGIVVPETMNKIVGDDNSNMNMDANGPLLSEVQQQHSSAQSLGAAAGYASVPTQQQQPQQVPSQYYQSSTSQTQQQQTQGATLPANLQSTHPNSMAQTQSMPQGAIPILTQQACPVTQSNNVSSQQQPTPQQQTITHPQTDEPTYVPVNSQAQSMGPPQVQNVCQPPSSGTPSQPPPSILVSQPQQQPQPAPPSTSQSQATQQQISESMQAAMQGMQSIQIHKVPQPGGPPPPQQQQQPQPQQLQPQVIQQSTQMQPTQQQQPSSSQQPSPQQQQQQQTTTGASAQVQMVGGMQQGNIAFHQQQQQQSESDQDTMANMMVAGALAAAATDAALLESLAEVTLNTDTDDHQVHEDNESMSGTSAVAIDNKIEQAMDLVKSHLMFAVREEVEVLKEKIAELMDRINLLEAENSILRAHATPEILAQLSQSTTTAATATAAASTKLPTTNNSGGGQ